MIPNFWCKISPFIRSKNFLLFLSALAFNLAFIYPHTAPWFVFFFLIPLFYLAFKERLSFGQGFTWGILFNFIHLYPYFVFFHQETNGTFRILVPLFLVLYFSCYSGLWFWLAKNISKIVKTNTWKVTFWVLVTYFYFTWMNHGCLFITGKCMGDPFGNPLLPLAVNHWYLYFLPFFGPSLLLLFLIIFAVVIVLFFTTEKKQFLVLAILALTPFWLGVLLTGGSDKSNRKANYVKNFIYIPPPKKKFANHPLDSAQEIYYKMVAKKFRPQTKCIVMPESSYRFCLNKMPDILEMWNTNGLNDSICFIIGAHRKEGDDVFNSVYFIKNGKIETWYDKTELMPFAEFVPNVWKKIPHLKNLFLDDDNHFCPGVKKDSLLYLDESITLDPCICAELFLRKNQNIPYRKDVIMLLIVNDALFSCEYMRNLMFLLAKFRSIQLSRKILYVGHFFARLIDKDGTVAKIG